MKNAYKIGFFQKSRYKPRKIGIYYKMPRLSGKESSLIRKTKWARTPYSVPYASVLASSSKRETYNGMKMWVRIPLEVLMVYLDNVPKSLIFEGGKIGVCHADIA